MMEGESGKVTSDGKAIYKDATPLRPFFVQQHAKFIDLIFSDNP